MRNNKSNKGFTLIELLIVIAIIGILAAVLIPNLLGARSRANDTVAQSCAKGLATASEVWNIDHNTYGENADGDRMDADFALTNGANACSNANLAVVLDTAADTTGYSHTVGHTGGTGVFTVTQDGVTQTSTTAPTSASPLTATP